jgi:hypothetical protein
MNTKEPSWRVLANDLIDGMIEWFGFRETLEWLKASGYTKEEMAFLGFDEEFILQMYAEEEKEDGVV